MAKSKAHRLNRASRRTRCGSRMAVSKSSAESASTVLEQGTRADHLTFVNTQRQAQRHRSTADLEVLTHGLDDPDYVNCRRNATPSLRPDPERCDFVREAFDRVATGESPVAVYADLVNRGFSTRRGRPVGRQTFYRTLRNEVYKGEFVTELEAGEGDWEPLVEPAVWEQVQAVLSQPERRGLPAAGGRREGKRPYRRVREGFELRRLLRCAECRRRITGGVSKGLSYMHCPNGHLSVRAEALNSGFCGWLASVRPNEVFLGRLRRRYVGNSRPNRRCCRSDVPRSSVLLRISGRSSRTLTGPWRTGRWSGAPIAKRIQASGRSSKAWSMLAWTTILSSWT